MFFLIFTGSYSETHDFMTLTRVVGFTGAFFDGGLLRVIGRFFVRHPKREKQFELSVYISSRNPASVANLKVANITTQLETRFRSARLITGITKAFAPTRLSALFKIYTHLCQRRSKFLSTARVPVKLTQQGCCEPAVRRAQGLIAILLRRGPCFRGIF